MINSRIAFATSGSEAPNSHACFAEEIRSVSVCFVSDAAFKKPCTITFDCSARDLLPHFLPSWASCPLAAIGRTTKRSLRAFSVLSSNFGGWFAGQPRAKPLSVAV